MYPTFQHAKLYMWQKESFRSTYYGRRKGKRIHSHYTFSLLSNTCVFFFLSRTVHLDIIKVFSLTDAQENCFKGSIKIYIKTAPTCFGVITIIRERTIRAC